MNRGDLIIKNGYFEIPFTETQKEMRLKASIKGEEFEFMLDSGAPVFISKEMQKKFQFPYIMRAKAKDASGQMIRTDIVRIDTIKFGPFIFTDIPALVLDITNSPIECFHLAGNIGSNVLRHLVVQFDLENKRIALADNPQLLKNYFSPVSRMTIDAQSNVFFPVKIDDEMSDTAHFDSGDGQLYEVSKKKAESYAAAHPADIVRKGYGTLSMGIGGLAPSFRQYVFAPGSIQLGNGKMTGGSIVIAGNDMSRMGRELLRYGILQLNYKDSTFAFKTYGSYAANGYDYGFKMLPDDDEVVVSCVWENGQAEQAGMVEGDHVLKINDADFTKMSKCEVSNVARSILLQGAPAITVTFRHKKKEPKTVMLQKQLLAK